MEKKENEVNDREASSCTPCQIAIYGAEFLSKYESVYETVAPPTSNFWKIGEWWPYTVACIHSPDFFSMQNMCDELDELIENMTFFYNEVWQRDEIKRKHISIGGYYAAYVEEYEKWYRVRVEGLVHGEGDPEYAVRVLDYGNLAIVPKDCLYRLRVMDVSLPVQCVYVQLYNNRNTRKEFTDEEKLSFRYKVGDKAISTFVLSAHSGPNLLIPKLNVIFEMIESDEIMYMGRGDFLS